MLQCVVGRENEKIELPTEQNLSYMQLAGSTFKFKLKRKIGVEEYRLKLKKLKLFFSLEKSFETADYIEPNTIQCLAIPLTARLDNLTGFLKY